MKIKRGNIVMVRGLSAKEFIAKAISIHGNRYNYSKVYYVNTRTDVHIICDKHGSFYQLPKVHLRGHGCQVCSGSFQRTKSPYLI